MIKQFMMWLPSISLVGVFLFLGGCATCTNCGSLQRSHEVRTIFTSEKVVPEYNYFHNGPIAAPRAIIGVTNKLEVEGRFWTPVEISQAQLSSWVTEIGRRPLGPTTGVNGQFDGFEILDVQGSRVGIWYSNFDWGVFKFPDESTINIFAPSFRPSSGAFSINNLH